LRPVLEEWADVSPLSTGAAAIYSFWIVTKRRQFDQFIDFVSDNIWVGWIWREIVWAVRVVSQVG
jgi:hypothetical protein